MPICSIHLGNILERHLKLHGRKIMAMGSKHSHCGNMLSISQSSLAIILNSFGNKKGLSNHWSQIGHVHILIPAACFREMAMQSLNIPLALIP